VRDLPASTWRSPGRKPPGTSQSRLRSARHVSLADLSKRGLSLALPTMKEWIGEDFDPNAANV